ncbi:MAG: cyclic nucleotide-binding domain-containing protein [Acidiferrobacteraceae bacterium]
MITDIIHNPVGLCVLTPEGALGFFSADNVFVVDEKMTSALRAHNLAFLAAYSSSTDGARFRVGAVGKTSMKRDWGPTSLFLEESILRDLYPVSGPINTELTLFQRRNQEKSLYRGIELLLEYRNMEYPDASVYCPVLFDRGVTLGAYPGLCACVTPVNADSAALDVLNLVAEIPIDRRESVLFGALKERIYSTVIHKELRRPGRLEVMQDLHRPQSPRVATDAAYVDAKRRATGEITLTSQGLDQLNTRHPVELRSQWAETSYPLDAARLREFVQFRDVALTTLALIASKAVLYTAPPGAHLLERGKSDPWNLYLLEGSITLTPAEGATLVVEGHSAGARSPVAFLRPRKYSVTALTKVTFLLIHDEILACMGTRR